MSDNITKFKIPQARQVHESDAEADNNIDNSSNSWPRGYTRLQILERKS